MIKGLALDFYELAMAAVYFKYKRHAAATFDLFVRSANRPFYVAAGVDDAVGCLEEFRFMKEDIDYLRGLNLFDDEFLSYLHNFKFKGQIFGVQEPQIIFANEPILRVSANLIEAQIIESILLNKINLATTLATKAARVVFAAKGKSVYDFSLRRTQGLEASLACAKYSYITGARGTSNVLAGFNYKIPVVGTMAHSFVMSFKREVASFLSFAHTFPKRSIFLIDTYDTKEGIKAAVKAAKFLKKRNFELVGIRIDSGDLLNDAKYVRNVLDSENMIDVIIFASGNLDEYRIDRLLRAGAPVDAFGVGTNLGCSSDLPYTDVIYKLVEIKEEGKDFIPTMKLSEGKTTLPSRKEIFRLFNRQGVMQKDILCLDGERPGGQKLLAKLMEDGVKIYKEKTIEEKRKIFCNIAASLPKELKDINSVFKYQAAVSKKLANLTKTLRREISKRVSRCIVFMDIDTQYDFLDKKGTLFVPGCQAAVKNIKALTKFAQKNNIFVIASQDSHVKDDLEFRKFPPHCVAGSHGHKKIRETFLRKRAIIDGKRIYAQEELRAISNSVEQIVIQKNTLNIFSNPHTAQILEMLFPDKVYVYGVATEYCVKEAVDGLLKNGFEAAVVTDAIKEISLKEKDKVFSSWKKQGVEFVDTCQIIRK